MDGKYVLQNIETDKWLKLDPHEGYTIDIDSFIHATHFSKRELLDIMDKYNLSQKDYEVFQLNVMARYTSWKKLDEQLDFQEYYNGMRMDQFKIIESISTYNHNYYVGLNNKTILGISDDDDTTEWYLVENETKHYLGESHTSQGELLTRFKNPRT